MPRTTTTTSVTTDGGGGIGGGLVVILGLLVLAPVIGVYVNAVISLLVTIVLCIVVLALTGGALYWLREFMRVRRLRAEQELLLVRHERQQYLEHRRTAVQPLNRYAALPPAQPRIIDAYTVPRGKELER